MTREGQTPGSPAEFGALFDLALREHRAGPAGRGRRGLSRDSGQSGPTSSRRPTTWPSSAGSRASSTKRRHFTGKRSLFGRLRRRPQQSGHGAAGPGQARPRRRHVSSKRSPSNRTTPRHTATWASSSGSGVNSTKRPHVTSKRWLFGPTFSTRTAIWAVCCCSQGKLGQALRHYQQALALRPDSADAHNNLGVVLRKQGKLDEALAQYEQAIALRPDHVEAHNNLGNVLKQQGKLDEALAQFERALALRPDYAERAQQPRRHPLAAGQARRSGRMLRASARPQARSGRSPNGPGRSLFGRRGLRAWLATV